MNRIILDTENIKSLKIFEAKYITKDYYLIVSSNNNFGIESKRISIKTLTFHWDKDDCSLIGIEAYTNMQNWSSNSLTVPNINETGMIYCKNYFDENNIADSISDLVEIWSYDSKSHLLNIKFYDLKPIKSLRIAKNLIIGINDLGEMAELWIENLIIE